MCACNFSVSKLKSRSTVLTCEPTYVILDRHADLTCWSTGKQRDEIQQHTSSTSSYKFKKKIDYSVLKWRTHSAVTRGIWGKERLKRWVSRRFWKTVSDDANVTFCDRVFHSLRELRGDRNGSVAEGWQTDTSNNKRWRWGRAETPTRLSIGRLHVELVSDIHCVTKATKVTEVTSHSKVWSDLQDCIDRLSTRKATAGDVAHWQAKFTSSPTNRSPELTRDRSAATWVFFLYYVCTHSIHIYTHYLLLHYNTQLGMFKTFSSSFSIIFSTDLYALLLLYISILSVFYMINSMFVHGYLCDCLCCPRWRIKRGSKSTSIQSSCGAKVDWKGNVLKFSFTFSLTWFSN